MQCGAKNDQVNSTNQTPEREKLSSIQIRCKRENGFNFVIKGKKKVLINIRFLFAGGGHPKAVLQLATPSRMDFDEFSELTSFMQHIMRLIGNVEESSKAAWESEIEKILRTNLLL
ncbi:hypothetical protein CEE45_09695 [Candidatus Heimdallarchaeota archaeon B3_Heim]|nr:MAG: hypothetical protein CEE45_09695 [Candidatus Heimdallarchaeota archaeon B3_Heim]